jgi:hypothetical protein
MSGKAEMYGDKNRSADGGAYRGEFGMIFHDEERKQSHENDEVVKAGINADEVYGAYLVRDDFH